MEDRWACAGVLRPVWGHAARGPGRYKTGGSPGTRRQGRNGGRSARARTAMEAARWGGTGLQEEGAPHPQCATSGGRLGPPCLPILVGRPAGHCRLGNSAFGTHSPILPLTHAGTQARTH